MAESGFLDISPSGFSCSLGKKQEDTTAFLDLSCEYESLGVQGILLK